MSSQTLFTKMKERVAFKAGWDRTTGNWGSDRDNLFETIKKDALSLFENPPVLPGQSNSHQWSFLFPFAELELTPAYATGTIAIAAGVVTLTGGTFPSWAAEGDLWVTDDDAVRRYTVNTRDSNTQVTLNDTTVAVTAGATYSLKRHYYHLPADFGGMYGEGFTYQRNSIHAGRVLRQVAPHELRLMDTDYLDGVPRCYALEPIPITATAGTLWRVSFAPLAGSQQFLEYRYRVVAADVDSTNDYPYGGAVHSETILAAVDVAVQRALHRDFSMEMLYFMDKLRMSVQFDRQNFKPIDYGTGRRHELCEATTARHPRVYYDDITFSWS